MMGWEIGASGGKRATFKYKYNVVRHYSSCRVGDTDLVDSDYEVQLIRPSVRCFVLVRVAISFTRYTTGFQPFS